MHRLLKFSYLIKASLPSKGAIFTAPTPNLNVTLVAGLYKPSAVRLEHGLILAALSGTLPVSGYQLHGKRQKRTVSLTSKFGNQITTLDKIIHEFLPRIGDFSTPKMKRPSNNNYIMRLKQKFTPLEDFEDLVSAEMFDDHRGVFLPLNLHLSFGLSLPTRTQIGAHYLRMLRIPLNFYHRRKAPAFDDLATFSQSY